MPAVHLEVEKKYVADDAFELPSLTELVRTAGADGTGRDGVPLAEGEARRQRLTATYFDTSDLRLAAAGLTLRRRTGGGDAGRRPEGPAARRAPAGGPPPPGPPPAARAARARARARARPGRRRSAPRS